MRWAWIRDKLRDVKTDGNTGVHWGREQEKQADRKQRGRRSMAEMCEEHLPIWDVTWGWSSLNAFRSLHVKTKKRCRWPELFMLFRLTITQMWCFCLLFFLCDNFGINCPDLGKISVFDLRSISCAIQTKQWMKHEICRRLKDDFNSFSWMTRLSVIWPRHI